jgi:hypothetical protein
MGGIATRKADMPVGRQKLDYDPRVIPMQSREARSQDIIGDRLDAGDGDPAFKARVLTR